MIIRFLYMCVNLGNNRIRSENGACSMLIDFIKNSLISSGFFFPSFLLRQDLQWIHTHVHVCKSV